MQNSADLRQHVPTSAEAEHVRSVRQLNDHPSEGTVRSPESVADH